MLVNRHKRRGQHAPVSPEILVLTQAVQVSIQSLFCTLLSPHQERRGPWGAFLQPWHCHRGQPHMCSAGAGSTHRGEAQCNSGISTWRECGLRQTVLNQKHLKGCPPLWLWGEIRKPFLSCVEGSLWGSLQPFPPQRPAKRSLLTLASPKTSTAFCYLGAGVSPLLSDKHLTQAPLQT